MTGSLRYPVLLLILTLGALTVSAIGWFDRTTWILEVCPIFIALPVLVLTAKRFPLTPLLYGLIFIHMLILIVGGHYSYARVPLGFWMEDWFHFARNNYDRIGHFAQGAVPAIAACEILLRKTPLKNGKMLFFIVTCICLAISAFYELFEWQTAVALGQGADEFLGTQGDPWDTQEDMATALVGAIIGQLVLAPWHNRQMARQGLVLPT